MDISTIKTNQLTECQKEFLFNSEYKYHPIYPEEKTVNFLCDNIEKGVGVYIGEECEDSFLTIYEKAFKKIFSLCEKCEYHK